MKIETELKYLPHHLQIEPTDNCNLDCGMCDRKNYVKNPSNLSFDRFKEIVDQIPYLKSVNIQGYGEPLINPELSKMLEYAKKVKKAHTVFYTNGTIMNEKLALSLLENLDEIRFSIDAGDKEIFEKIRHKADYDRIINNIKLLIRVRRENNSKTPKIEVRATAMMLSIRTLPSLARLCKEIRIDKFMVSALEYQPATPLGQKEQLIYNMDRKELKEIVEEILAVDMETSIDQAILKLLEPSTELVQIKNSGKKYCWWLWNALYVSKDGGVQPCCYYWYNNKGDVINSSLAKKPLKEIWNSGGYKILREALLKGEPHDFCKGCSQIQDIPPGFEVKYKLSRMKNKILAALQ